MAQIGQYKEQTDQEFILPDEGFYILKLVGEDDPIQSKYDKPEGSGNFPWRVNLKFEIVRNAIDGDTQFAGVEVGKFVGLDLETWRDDSVYHVLKALDPAEEPQPEDDTKDYYGKLAVGEIFHNRKQNVKEPGKVNVYANVGKLKEYKRKPKAKPAPPPVETDDDSDALFGDGE